MPAEMHQLELTGPVTAGLAALSRSSGGGSETKRSRRRANNPPVPDRRRQHFSRRVRLDEQTRAVGRRGLAQAREVLRQANDDERLCQPPDVKRIIKTSPVLPIPPLKKKA